MAEAKPRNTPVDLLALAGVTELAVASTGTAYSHSIPLPKNTAFGLEIKFASSGTVDVQVDLEQGNQVPTTEGSADATWAVTDQLNADTNITDTNKHIMAVAPVVTTHARLKFTGEGSNHASTKITVLKLVFSENA